MIVMPSIYANQSDMIVILLYLLDFRLSYFDWQLYPMYLTAYFCTTTVVDRVAYSIVSTAISRQ